MKNRFFLILLFSSFILLNQINAQILVSYELKRTYTLADIQTMFDQFGIPSGVVNLQIKHKVKAYKVTYHTVGVDSITPTIASGVFFVPEGYLCKIAMVDYNHGTMFERTGAPSFMNTEENKLGVLFATDGYAVAMPDYLGLGVNEGIHPYMHARSEATSAIDMIRACKELSDTLSLALNGQLFLAGYSQGGHVTMATHKYIQKYFNNEIPVTASAPMSGPFDVSGAQSEVITSDLPFTNPEYLPYVIMSYRYAYGIYPDIESVFRNPYNTIIPHLIDGEHSGWDVYNACANPPKLMLDSIAYNDFINDSINNQLRKTLIDNDVYDWITTSPIKIIYCGADQTVVPANSINAYNKFVENGCDSLVKIMDCGYYEHYECALWAMLSCKIFFDSYRNIALSFTNVELCTHRDSINGSAKVIVKGGVAPHTYLWKNGDTTSFSNHLRFGWNKLTVTDNGGCVVSDSIRFWVSGMDEKTTPLMSLNIYPNPADNVVTIDISIQKYKTPKTINIYSLSGKLIDILPVLKDQRTVVIDIKNYSIGIYFVKCTLDNDEYMWTKFIKKEL